MRVIAYREDMLPALKLAKLVVLRSTKLSVLLRGYPGVLVMTAMGMHCRLTIRVPCLCEQEGSLQMPCRDLLQAVATLPSGQEIVLVSSGDGDVSLTCGSRTMEWLNCDAADSGSIVISDPDPTVSQLAMPVSLIQQVARAIEPLSLQNGTRPVLTSVLVSVQDGKAAFVGADGFRLGILRADAGVDAALAAAMIPNTSWGLVARVFAGSKTPIWLGIGESAASFASITTTLVTPLIRGEYPDWLKLIPETWDCELQVNRLALLAAVNFVAPVASQSSGIVRLVRADGSIALSAAVADKMAVRCDVPAAVRGDLQVAFDYQYLQHALKHLSGESVRIRCTRTTPACLSGDDSGPEYVIMPMDVLWDKKKVKKDGKLVDAAR